MTKRSLPARPPRHVCPRLPLSCAFFVFWPWPWTVCNRSRWSSGVNGGNGGGGSGGGAGGGGAGGGSSGGSGSGSGGGGGGTSGRSSTAARDSRRQTRVIRTGRDRGSGLLGSQPQPVIPASVIPEELITQVQLCLWLSLSALVWLSGGTRDHSFICVFTSRLRLSYRVSPGVSSSGNSSGPTWTSTLLSTTCWVGMMKTETMETTRPASLTSLEVCPKNSDNSLTTPD